MSKANETYSRWTGSQRAEPSEQCPNCGRWFRLGHCHYSSSIKTDWGGSTLYGVCSECAENHAKRDVANAESEAPK